MAVHATDSHTLHCKDMKTVQPVYADAAHLGALHVLREHIPHIPAPSAPPPEAPEPSAPPYEDEVVIVPPPAPSHEKVRVVEKETWSSYRIKRVVLNTIGGMSFVGAAASFSGVVLGFVPPVGLFAAIGMATAGIFCASAASSVIDYHNEQELEKLRADVEQKPLDEIVRVHGADKIFEFGILLPATLYKKTCEYADIHPFSKTLKMVTHLSNALNAAENKKVCEYGFSLPHPLSWKWKFEEELKEINVHEFSLSYSLDSLVSWGMISPKAHAALHDIVTECTENVRAEKRTISGIRRKYASKIAENKRQMEKDIHHVRTRFETHPNVARLRNLENEYESKVAFLLQRIEASIEREDAEFASFRDGVLLGHTEENLDNQQIDALQRRREEHDAIVLRLQNEARHEQELLMVEKEEIRRSLSVRIYALEVEKESHIETLYQRAHAAIDALKDRCRDEIETVSRRFVGRFTAINAAFRQVLVESSIL